MKKILFQLLLLGFSNTFCQTFIVREDNLIVNQDTSVFYDMCGDSSSIDVNSDGKIDFTIRYTCPIEVCCQDVYDHNCSSHQSEYISLRVYNNFETYNFGAVTQLPGNFSYNDTLDKYQGEWFQGGWLMSEFYGGPGCSTWYNVGNWASFRGYLIFRNRNNDNPVYGWIDIQVAYPKLGFKIFGFGVEDKLINSLADNRLDGIKILYENNHLILTNIKNKINITLIDLNGRIVYQQIIISDANIKIEQFRSGLYILKVSDDHASIIRKIIK